MTLSDLLALTDPNKGKLAKRHLQDDTGESPPQKRSRQTTIKQISVDTLYLPSRELTKVKAETNKLRDKVIVVEPPKKDVTLKAQLEKIMTLPLISILVQLTIYCAYI